MGIYKEFYGRPDHWGFLSEERHYDDFADIDPSTTVVSLRRDDKNWEALADLDHLEEITAINLRPAQIAMLLNLRKLKRLRLCEIRRTQLEGLREMEALEELALLSVSGPKSLSFLAQMPKLRSLMIENMRSLDDFSDLDCAPQLECLVICSGANVEVSQPVRSLRFLTDLSKLEHLGLGGNRYLEESPVFEPLLRCQALASCYINNGFITLTDTAFLLAKCPFVTFVHETPWEVQGKDEHARTLEQLNSLTSEVLDFTPWGKGERYRSGSKDRIIPIVREFEARLHTEMEKFS